MALAQPLTPTLPSPLARLVEDYLSHCRAGGLAPATLNRSYGPALRSIFVPWCDAEDIQRVEQLDERSLDRFTSALLDRPSGRGGQLSKHSVRSYVRPIRLFLGWAARHGEDVRAKPRLPKAGRRHRDVLRREEIDALEAAAVSERDKLIIRVFGDCGLRLGELAGLRARDIIRSGHQAHFHVRGKGDRERRVPVPPLLLRRLQRYLDGRTGDMRTDRIFVAVRRSPAGDYPPLSESGVKQVIEGAGERAQLGKRVHPHLLRHSWMTEMLRRGMNPIQLSVIAGASQQVIAAHYQHLTQDDAYEAMSSAPWCDWVDAACAPYAEGT